MNCLECHKLDLQTHKKHAACGFGRCPHDPVGTFVNIRMVRTCSQFKPAAPDIVAARIEWAQKS